MALRATALLLLLGAGCARTNELRYHWVGQTSVIVLDGQEDKIDGIMRELGVDYLYGLSDLGSCPILVSGSRETMFRVRRRLLELGGDRVWWPADCLVPFEHADQLGTRKGPWTRIAGVRHQVTPTERVLDDLEVEGMATYFYFGGITDWVFVSSSDAARAAELLRGAAIPGVELLQ